MTRRWRAVVAALCWLWLAGAAGWCAWRFRGPPPVETDIQSMLPDAGGRGVETAAIRRAGQTASARIALMVTSADADLSAQAAADLSARLEADGFFVSDRSDGEATARYVFARRDALSCEGDPARLDAAWGRREARQSLARLYGVGAAVTGDLLVADPFLRTPQLLACLSPPTGAASDPTRVLVSGRLSGSAFRFDVQDDIAARIDGWRSAWAERDVGLSRVGAVFHARASAERAKAEMSLVGAIGSAGVVILFWLVFRRIWTVLASLALVGVAMTGGLAATLLVFPSVHVMVFVFAAMLVGVVSDYAIHALATGPGTGWAPASERFDHVFRPITISMLTTVLGFGGLALFGVPLFQQVALLSGVGVFTAWAFVLFVLVPMDRRPRQAERLKAAWDGLSRLRAGVRAPRWLVVLAALAVAAGCVAGAIRFRGEDDVRSFQPRRADLAAEEQAVRDAGFLPPGGGAFLLSEGATPELARRAEEAALASAPEGVRLIASTRLSPSQARADATRAAIAAHLTAPHLAERLDMLGLDPAASPAFGADAPPPGWVAELAGESGGRHYLIAPVIDAAGWDGAGLEGARLVDPASGYSRAFAGFRMQALMALAAAAAAAAVIVLAAYRDIRALTIVAAPLAAALAAVLLPSAFGAPVTFFSAAATLVLFGVAIDYCAFEWEAGQSGDPWTPLAVTVDAATTLLSMGLLAVSDTLPVRSFGLTVAIGVAAALTLAHIPRAAGRQAMRRRISASQGTG